MKRGVMVNILPNCAIRAEFCGMPERCDNRRQLRPLWNMSPYLRFRERKPCGRSIRANLPTLASGCEPAPACQQILCLGSTFCFSAIVGEALITGYAATGFHELDRFPEQ